MSEQISFDELEFEGAYEEETEYLSISGNEYRDTDEMIKVTLNDLEIYSIIEGYPEITYFENKERKSDSLRLRVIDKDGDEYADLYINIPKPDEKGFVSGINSSFDFYRTAFDFIYSILYLRDEKNVIDERNGEPVNRFNKVNILNFAKYVDNMHHISLKITEGNTTSDYNSWIITKME